MKLRAIAIRLALIVLVLTIGLAGTLYWASRSEAVLRWAIAHAAQRLPGKLELDGVTGSLTRPIGIAHVHYAHEGLIIDAYDAALDWAPWELVLRKQAHVIELRMRQLTLALPDGKGGAPAKPPDDLALPLPVLIDRLIIETLAVRNGSTALFAASDVRLGYAGDARNHRLELQHIGTQWGSVAATLQMAAGKPFALHGHAEFKGGVAPQWPAVVHIDLSGTLSAVDAAAKVQLRDTPITGSARIAPFATLPLESITVKSEGIDLDKLVSGAPRTLIDVVYEARGTTARALEGRLTLSNRLPGTIDQAHIPVTTLQGHLVLAPAGLKLSSASIELAAAGKATLEAEVTQETTDVTLTTQRLDLRGVHSALRSTHLAGTVSASIGPARRQYRGTLSQDNMRLAFVAHQKGDVLQIESAQANAGTASVTASGSFNLASPNAFSAHGELRRFDPAAFGNFPAADVNGSFDASGSMRPQWRVAAAYRLARSSFRGQPLSGNGKLTATARALSAVEAQLGLGRNRLHLQGALGQEGDVMRVELDAPALSALGPQWSGNARARGSVSGTFAHPGFELDASARALTLPGGYHADTLQVRGRLQPDSAAQFDFTGHAQGLQAGDQTVQSADVHGAGSLAQHQLEARVLRAGADLSATAEGSWNTVARSWSGQIKTLENRGEYPFKLAAPATLSLAPERLAVGSAKIELIGGRIDLGELRYARGELNAGGAVTGVSLAKLLEWAKVSAPVQTSMLIGGRWNITTRQHVDGHVELHRESGDASVAVDEERIALEISQLALAIDIHSDALTAELRAEGKRLGQLTARAQTRLSQREGRWGISSRAPLSLSAKGEIVTIKPIAALLSRSIAADGRVTIAVSGDGTVSEPNLRGRVDAQQIRIEQVENGVFLHDGVIHATFDDRALAIQEFSIAAGSGRFNAKGRVLTSDRHLEAHLDWQADHLAAVQRPDLFVALSGTGTLAYEKERVALKGQLRVDRGRVELRSGSAPSLDDDVVVVGRKSDGAKARVLDSIVDLTFDLGPDFKVTGSGLDARVEGKLHLTSPGNAPLSARGEISLVHGTYEAYGRKLEIDKGTLYFTGPLDNPGLNIRALRKNQQVEAGVEISGTVRAPRVTLVSTPEVPDAEKLAWLVLGRRVDANNRNDAQALQSSAALLLADVSTSPLQKQLAKGLGLDEIGIAASDTSTPGGTGSTGGTGGVVTLGKRLSERIYVIFEGGFGAAASAVKVNYQLSRRWSLRTESGRTEAVDLFYSFSWD